MQCSILYFFCLFAGGSSAESASLDVDDGSALRTSKSDTSLTDSFVVVPEARKKTINPMNVLRPGKPILYLKLLTVALEQYFIVGFKWQRQLVFRSKLTMHTAYDRKDNAEPASITALAVSK